MSSGSLLSYIMLDADPYHPDPCADVCVCAHACLSMRVMVSSMCQLGSTWRIFLDEINIKIGEI
jgi:hypothetical protein